VLQRFESQAGQVGSGWSNGWHSAGICWLPVVEAGKTLFEP
jgi:hypothetical protein